MSDTKKYYWLKLQKDFFKRHDIRIIEEMKNGKDYILFYMKLLVESISHDGHLRFSETIPYNESMLATITHTNIDIVRSAIKLFLELHLMDILDDGTFYMGEIEKMLGCETEWAEKKRIYRSKKLIIVDKKRTKKDEVRQELEKEIEIEKDKEYICRFTPPTLDEVIIYCQERRNKVDAEKWLDFYTSKGWMVGKNKMKDWKACVRTWEKNDIKITDKQFDEREYDESDIEDLYMKV